MGWPRMRACGSTMSEKRAMTKWTIGRRIAAGYAVLILLLIALVGARDACASLVAR